MGAGLLPSRDLMRQLSQFRKHCHVPPCGAKVEYDLNSCKTRSEVSLVSCNDRELQSIASAASNMGPLVPHEPQAALAAAKKEFGEYESCRAFYRFLLHPCSRVLLL